MRSDYKREKNVNIQHKTFKKYRGKRKNEDT